MPWLFVIETSFSTLRPCSSFSNSTYFILCKKLIVAVAGRLCAGERYECFSVVKPGTKDTEHEIIPFTTDLNTIIDTVEALPGPLASPHLHGKIDELVNWSVQECMKICGKIGHTHVLVITDGGVSAFNAGKQAVTEVHNSYPNCSLIICSLSTSEISAELLSLSKRFAHPLALVDANEVATFMTADEDSVLRKLTDAILQRRNCEPCEVGRQLPSEQNTAPVTLITCGHFSSNVHLVPSVCFSNQTINLSTRQLHVEVFGFLNSADISNPPVHSRHTVVKANTDNNDFLHLLLSALQVTKTVALVNLNAIQPGSLRVGHVSDKAVTESNSSVFITHGFLHRYDAKRSSLLLSIFHADCTELPWLGQFAYLAPVADFGGTQVYDDANNLSPFPVRVADRLSYKTMQPASRSEAGNKSTTESFSYLSWITSQTLTMDANKLLRLARRLPDKSAQFYKELHRVRSAALAYGCHELLQQLYTLIQAIHIPATSSVSEEESANPVLTSHLRTIANLLLADKQIASTVNETIVASP